MGKKVADDKIKDDTGTKTITVRKKWRGHGNVNIAYDKKVANKPSKTTITLVGHKDGDPVVEVTGEVTVEVPPSGNVTNIGTKEGA